MTAIATRQLRVRVAHPRLFAGGGVVAVFGLLLVPWFAAPGWALDEGGLLAYADRVLAGDVPMRNLHSFYGPLSTYLLAGVFKVFGPSVEAERGLGLVYRLVLVAALLFLVRRRGVAAIVGAGLIAALLLPSQGVAAYAIYGALACAAAGIALADARRPFAAGVAGGLALMMRFDWVLPIALAAIPFFAVASWRDRRRLLFGGLVGAGAYVPYLAVVGVGRLQMVIAQLRAGQSGRAMSLPSVDSGRGHLLELTVGAIVVLIASGLRRRRTREGIVFLAVGLLGAGLLPYALLRSDRAHILVVAIAPVVLLAAALPAAVDEVRDSRRTHRLAVTVVVGLVVAALALHVAARVVRGDAQPLLALDPVAASLNVAPSYAVAHDGRSFPIGNAAWAVYADRALDRADALAPPGGTLFVGPGDLRRTVYVDAYMYYLLPRLRPATFYITLDPGSTNLRGARLADELPRADVLILNDAYDSVPAPNGTAAPNRVVARLFCPRGTYGPFRVLARCTT